MNIKRLATVTLVCILATAIFGSTVTFGAKIVKTFIVNTNSDPVPVEIVNSPELQPVQFTTGFYIYSGDSAGGNEEAFEVPAGKLLVIEYVSARALYLHPDDTLSLMLLTTLNGDVNPTFLGVFESQGNTWQTLSKEVKVYCDPETFVTVFGNRETSLNYAEIMVSMTGHLVDAS